jgi:hypothetical protein
MSARVMRSYHGSMRQGLLLFAAIVSAWAAAGHGQVPDRAEAARAFETVKQVLQHPRCQNCHIPGNAPLQYDQGLPHAMKVERGADGHGTALKCSNCHQTSNPPAGYSLHAPPGAPNWHLPPANMKMVFKDLTSAELCRVLKDPKRNGGKTPEQLLKHVAEDKLVLWGWEPGGERTPVPVPHAQFVAAFKQWISEGMPCS